MNIETLKVFRDLADTGSFSKTAELNYVSQSAVSQQVKKLELVLKCKLYHRQSGRLTLTPCGEKFYAAARKVASVYDGALKTIGSLARDKRGEEIRISTIYSAGAYMVQGYVRRFLARNPGSRVSVAYRRFSQVYSDVSSGKADLGFLACPDRKCAGLAMVPAGEEEMALVTGAGSPLAGRKSVSVRELAGLDFVFFERAFPSRRHTDAFLRSHGVRPRVKLEFDDIETIKTAVASGAGVSLLPRAAIREEESGVTLHALRISDAEFLRPIYLVHSRARKLSDAARKFLSVLEAPRKAQGRP